MTTTTRETVIEKIVNLRAKGESTGSEAEAMACFARAERMMRAYNVEEAELALAEASGVIVLDVVTNYTITGVTKSGANDGKRSKAILAHYALEKFCEVQTCYSNDYSQIRVTGHRPDVALFHYLATVIHNALDSAYDSWRMEMGTVGRGAKASFQQSMALRIGQRLTEMTAARKAEQAAAVAEADKLISGTTTAVNNGNLRELTSTALVVASIAQVKAKEVTTAFRTANPRLSKGDRFSFTSRNSTAASAGRSAGNTVSFARPLGTAPASRIGSR